MQLFRRGVAFAAAPDVFPPDKFNAGVMVIRPDAAIFQDMLLKISILRSHDGGDTGHMFFFGGRVYLAMWLLFSDPSPPSPSRIFSFCCEGAFVGCRFLKFVLSKLVSGAFLCSTRLWLQRAADAVLAYI